MVLRLIFTMPLAVHQKTTATMTTLGQQTVITGVRMKLHATVHKQISGITVYGKEMEMEQEWQPVLDCCSC